MDLYLVNLGSVPTDTHMNHWWTQDRHPAKISPMHQQVLPILVGISDPLTGLSTAKKKFQDKNFHKFQDKFQDTWQVVGRSNAQTRVDNGYMYGPRISKL